LIFDTIPPKRQFTAPRIQIGASKLAVEWFELAVEMVAIGGEVDQRSKFVQHAKLLTAKTKTPSPKCSDPKHQ
jgi:hypothetical protein